MAQRLLAAQFTVALPLAAHATCAHALNVLSIRKLKLTLKGPSSKSTLWILNLKAGSLSYCLHLLLCQIWERLVEPLKSLLLDKPPSSSRAMTQCFHVFFPQRNFFYLTGPSSQTAGSFLNLKTNSSSFTT